MMSPFPCRSTSLFAPATALLLRSATAFLAATAFVCLPVRAADLYSGGDLDIRWDNTLAYSAGFRISPRDPKLSNDPDDGEGDRNFAQGLISNRVDLLSVFDLSKGEYGIHASVAAWYDTVYHTRTAQGTEFAPAVRALMGEYVDLEDAFAYGNFDIGDMPVSARIGRQNVLWGESLFVDQNSIAAAQAPIDFIEALNAPLAYSEDVFLPVDQASVTFEPRPDISLAFYYQFEWRSSRLPGVGSYFSDTDYLGEGAEGILLAPGTHLLRGADQTPAANGQLGASLHAHVEDWDLGLYALQFNAEYPVVMLDSNIRAGSGDVGQFGLYYPTGIQLYGASFSGYAGDSTVAGEISTRTHAPLASLSPVSLYSSKAPPGYDDDSYAEGDTLHAQLSSVTTLPPSPAWNSADLSVEAAANDVLKVTQNRGELAPSAGKFAVNIRALFEPHYFEVLPNLDLGIPLGFGYDLAGSSDTIYAQGASAGDVETGLSATYLSVWKAHLTLTCFLGGASAQPLADRNFVSIRVERAF